MKLLIILIINFSSITFATELSPQATDMKFITDFTNFACRSFRDKVSAPEAIHDLQVKYTKLGISSSTRRVVMDIESLDRECFYSADYSRKKGTTQLIFQESYMTNTPKCLSLKQELDQIMEPGFKYRIKFNAYISMLFLKEMKGQCDDDSGKNLIEFQWMI